MKLTPLFHMRPLAYAALGMLLGTLLSFALDASAICPLAGFALLGMLILALWNRRAGMIVCGFFALAALLVCARTLSPAPAGRHAVTGRVAEPPAPNGYGGYVLLLDSVCIDGRAFPGRLRLSAPREACYGDTVEAEAFLRAEDPAFAASNAYRRLCGSGYAPHVAVTGHEEDVRGIIFRLRAAISARIDALFLDSGGVASGMLLGDKSGIDAGRLADYRASGAAHLLAVSGLHVSILAGAWMLLFRRRPWLRFAMTALFLLVYCVLTAFAPSVLRAAVMLLCFSLSRPLRRPPDRLSSLSLAFVLILFYNPFALFYAGFQLSFLAVYGLITLAPLFANGLRRIGQKPAELIGASLSIGLSMLPAQAAFFESVPLTAVAGNLFLLPLAPFFLVPAFAVTALSFLSLPLAETLAVFPRLALRAIDFIARLGGPALSLPVPNAPATLLYLAALLFFSRLCMRQRARRALYGGCLLAAALALWLL